jgi:hypothetical protein
MRKKRTLAVRFSEPSGLLAYSAAPARNAAMSMMKPVDNHTTSMGMMEIMGSRTGPHNRSTTFTYRTFTVYGATFQRLRLAADFLTVRPGVSLIRTVPQPRTRNP